MNRFPRLDRDRLSVISGAVLLALALSRYLDVPARYVGATVFGSPVRLTLSATTLMMAVIAGMALTGAASLVRSHPLARQGKLPHTTLYALVPALCGLGLAASLSRLEDLGQWIAALLLGGGLFVLVLAAEYLAISPPPQSRLRVHWLYVTLVHLVALMLYVAIYHWRARSLLSATATLVVTGILATRLLSLLPGRLSPALQHGWAIGLLAGQFLWVLNYLPLTSLQGGVLLLLLFYVATGLFYQDGLHQLTRGMLWQYGGVALLALLVMGAGLL